ncbi:MAG: dihydrolipoyl dehydrogenase [Chitinophagales bacterium]|nr:dihydrolipoyl dehydrogenase [Chitinophagales bacterium]
MNYDLIVIGSGPGGYVAAIRASQLNLRTAIVERESLGGICLNWGCIPTKALLKSANVFEYIKHSQDYGITVSESKINFDGIVKRSRDVANGMSRGVQFLMKKNKIDVVMGTARVKPGNKIEVVDNSGKITEMTAKNIMIATGSRSKILPTLHQDGKNIIGYREAMVLPKQPATMVIVGAGAIGCEFAYFFNTLGTKVILIEFLRNIVPVEDEEISKELEKSFKKQGIVVMTNSAVEKVEAAESGNRVYVKTSQGQQVMECEIVLSAAGVSSNIENIGLEETGIKTDKGKVVVDDFYQTNIPGYYAIGDIVKGPALAHVASAEGIICVEKIAGKNPEPLDYNNLPGCTYCSPEIASVGYTEKTAKDAGFEIKVGKFPFSASGKASAAGAKEGFVKLIFDAKYGEFLGAHMIGSNVTELIAECVAARKLETTGHELIKAVHPHPTMSEAIMEAAAAAYGEVIHL